MDNILPNPNSWTAFEVAAALSPTLIFLWVILTVRALHRRQIYFWSLGSTWTTIIGCPAGLVIASSSAINADASNAIHLSTLLIAGLGLYTVALAYSVLYNYNATKSAALAVSTSVLQQLAVAGLLLLFLRWHEHQTNRRRRLP